MKKVLIGFLLSLIPVGIIGIVIASDITANDVSYTPKDNFWNVNNVDAAITSLYNTSKNFVTLNKSTTVNSNNLLKGFTAYNSNGEFISGQFDPNCVGGSWTCTSCTTDAGQKLLDYIPSYFMMYAYDSSSSAYTNWYYNSSTTDGKIYILKSGENNSYGTNNKYFKDNKLVFNNFASAWNGKKFVFVACK